MLDPGGIRYDPSGEPLRVSSLHIDSLSMDLCKRTSSQDKKCVLLQEDLTLTRRKTVHFGPSSIMDSQTSETFHDEDSFRSHMEEMRKCIKLKRRQRRILSFVPAMLLVPLGLLLAHIFSW